MEQNAKVNERFRARKAVGPGRGPLSRLRILGFLAALFVTAIAVEAHAEDRVALIVANAQYAGVPSLRTPSADADIIGAALKKVGFKVTIVSDAGRAKLEAVLETFSDAADQSDVALVYFSGHGMEVDGRNFVIPVDAVLHTERDLDTQAVPLDTVLSKVKRARRLRIVVLDACRNNPFAARITRRNGTRAADQGLAPIEPRTETLVAFAAKAGSTAADGTGANSPFARALADGIVQPGVEIDIMFRRVRDAVLESTGGAQEPFVYSSLSGQEFYFMRGAAAATPRPSDARRVLAGDAGDRKLELFRDCPETQGCPLMQTVGLQADGPVGAGPDEAGASDPERPSRDIRFRKRYALSVGEVSFAEWDACVADGGCDDYRPPDEGWGRGSRPALNVSWLDAQDYVTWLSETSGRKYRLPSESEWERAARLGAPGSAKGPPEPTCGHANLADAGAVGLAPLSAAAACKDGFTHTAPREALKADAGGYRHLIGNVWEWTQDCYVSGRRRTPEDGSAYEFNGCEQRVIKGGSWATGVVEGRPAARAPMAMEHRDATLGFRVARDW